MTSSACIRVLALATAMALTSGASAAPIVFPGNGNAYELIRIQTTWANARTLASTYAHGGTTGHLATVTSAAENTFLADSFATGLPAAFAWIAGHEPGDDGVWFWGAGPESGVQFAQSAVATAPYHYVNWAGVEPNDYAPGEDFAAINLGALFAGVPPGAWIDSPNPNPADPIFGFIVEYEAPTAGVAPGGTLPALLQHASPNPLRRDGTLHLDLTRPAQLDVAVFDLTGRKVATLATRARVSAGRATWPLDARLLPAGICFVRTTGVWSDGGGGRVEHVTRVVVAR